MRSLRPVTASQSQRHSFARRCSAGGPRVAALRFGRKSSSSGDQQRPLLSPEDVRLFLSTFAGGFIFVTVLIA